MYVSNEENVGKDYMKKTPKVFVGTLYVNEPQFEKCCDAISSQKGVEVTHSIIKGKSELEAHNILWNQWNTVRSCYDMFVKVDADTVLREGVLQQAAELMTSDKRITGMQIPLHDYFTNVEIAGLNCFSQT